MMTGRKIRRKDDEGEKNRREIRRRRREGRRIVKEMMTGRKIKAKGRDDGRE